MADESPHKPNQSAEAPEPEVLVPRDDDVAEQTKNVSEQTKKKNEGGLLSLRARYHLSHKATFIGIAVVVLILAINAGIIAFVLNNQTESDDDPLNNQVTIDQEVLSKLGVNRAAVDDLGAELTVGPHARFDKTVQIGGDVGIGGDLTLNNGLLTTTAEVGNLQAQDASFEQLNVNSDATLTNLNLRNNLTVAGATRFQGPVTVTQLLTAEAGANVNGNLTVGGVLTVNTFQTGNLVVNSTTTLGGHIITRGSAPSVSAGPAAGSNGTVSISGNDTSGTVAVNAGTGAGNGIVANITFRNKYNSIPHVVVTPIGNVGSFYIFRTRDGFSIGVGNSLSPGGYAFDYIVMQ